jgi:protein-tyrosine phosphatase
MIDFHNHVLAGVDDGPKFISESLKMLRHANKQRITDVVQTVHFQHPKMDGKNVNFNYLKSKVLELQSLIDNEGLSIKIHLSAEVFYLPNLVEISKNPLLTIGKDKYMLIEFSNNIYPIGFEEEFYKLQSKGITPIIAHPERYSFVQKNIEVLQAWIDRGYVLQLDAGSIIGQFGTKIQSFSNEIISNGYFHFIGSDAHNSNKRNFCIKDSYDYIQSIHSVDLITTLKSNVEDLLMGKTIYSISNLYFSNKKVNKIYKLKKMLLKFVGL